MPPYESPTPSPPNPLAPLTELLDRLLSTALHLGLGVVLGVLAASVMRRRHLRWTWAPPALVLVALAHAVLAGWTSTLIAATLCAAARGHRRHREDIALGGDLAEIAAARRGPLAALRTRALRLSQRYGPAPERHALRGERMILGATGAGHAVSIPFGARGGGRHTLIVGATGSGKTVTETWILARAIEAGLGAVVLDPKGDTRLRAHLLDAATRSGRRFVEWTPSGPSVYNPFGHGAAGEIADKALAGERFTEPHYQRQAQRYLGHAVRALHGTGAPVSLPSLVRRLDPSQLDVLARGLPEEQARLTHEYLDSLTPRQRADLGGVRDRLAIMAESDVAPWLDPATPGADAFDLLSAVRERAVVYFALESDARPLLARMLGVAIVQDLQTTMAALQRSPIATVVAIDEFAAIAAAQVGRLFGRARSAGINLLLGAQELSDLRPEDHPRLLEQVLGNLSALIAHRQVVPESADLIARLTGGRGAWRTSQGSAGRWTRTRTSAPLLAPEQIRALSPGWAAVAELGGRPAARVAHVYSTVLRGDAGTPARTNHLICEAQPTSSPR